MAAERKSRERLGFFFESLGCELELRKFLCFKDSLDSLDHDLRDDADFVLN